MCGYCEAGKLPDGMSCPFCHGTGWDNDRVTAAFPMVQPTEHEPCDLHAGGLVLPDPGSADAISVKEARSELKRWAEEWAAWYPTSPINGFKLNERGRVEIDR